MIDPRGYVLQRAFRMWPTLTAEQAARFYLNSPEFRREVTRDDPLAFAFCYLEHHLTGEDTGGVTLSEAHVEMIRVAQDLSTPDALRTGRHAFILPRRTGKSTWAFTILPLWAAAHGHRRFIAAFADTAGQAETHLRTYKHELKYNTKLNYDYPDLCTLTTDNQKLAVSISGFAFAAKGAGTGTLGLKVNKQRPDLLILDDIEPPENDYSYNEAVKRLSWLEDAVLPLDETAKVFISGTTTMSGSIMHQLVLAARDKTPEKWITDQRIEIHYLPAILPNPDGTRRSIWPERWPLSYLESIEHTRDYSKNFANLPVPLDSEYWTYEDFIHRDIAATRTVMSIDPAVTTKHTSDQTAIAVVGFNANDKLAVVKEATAVRLRGAELRTRVLALLNQYPEIQRIVIEANQGQDLWLDVLHDLPVPVMPFSAKDKKEVRAVALLNHYQRRRVLHSRRFTELEQQMLEFPKGLHDDLVDAVAHGVAAVTSVGPKGIRVRSA